MNKISEEYPLVERRSIKGHPNDSILICSGKPSFRTKDEDLPYGVEFLKKYNAWGFLKPCRKVPFFALYVAAPVSSIKYFAEIKGFFDPSLGESHVERYEEYPNYQVGRRLIKLKNIRILKNPIPYKKIAIQNTKFVDMDTFKSAETTLDLFSHRI